MGSYYGKVCRASNRNVFDDSGVWFFSVHIPGACRPLSALLIDLLIPQEVISDVNTMKHFSLLDEFLVLLRIQSGLVCCFS